MAVERTLSIIKPDAVAQERDRPDLRALRSSRACKVVAARMVHLSRSEAEGFYAVHHEPPVLQRPRRVHDLRPGDGAGARGRERDREEPRADGRDRPEEGRRRARSAPTSPQSIDANAVHGSDGAGDRAQSRSPIFFPRARSTRAERDGASAMDDVNLLDFDAAGARPRSSPTLGEKPFRAQPGVALDPPARRGRLRRA